MESKNRHVEIVKVGVFVSMVGENQHVEFAKEVTFVNMIKSNHNAKTVILKDILQILFELESNTL